MPTTTQPLISPSNPQGLRTYSTVRGECRHVHDLSEAEHALLAQAVPRNDYGAVNLRHIIELVRWAEIVRSASSQLDDLLTGRVTLHAARDHAGFELLVADAGSDS